MPQISPDRRLPVCWDSAAFCWNRNEYCWDDVYLVREIIKSGGGDPTPGNSLNQTIYYDDTPYFRNQPEKRKRLIKLICKVQGKEYIEERKIGDVKITAHDIKILAKEVLGINVKVILN